MMLADHVWQSTLFLVAAALVTLGLRKNHARVRYGVWLAASLKFLVPFTLLVAMSRVVLGLHYPSDVIAATLIGCGLGSLSLWLMPAILPF